MQRLAQISPRASLPSPRYLRPPPLSVTPIAATVQSWIVLCLAASCFPASTWTIRSPPAEAESCVGLRSASSPWSFRVNCRACQTTAVALPDNLIIATQFSPAHVPATLLHYTITVRLRPLYTWWTRQFPSWSSCTFVHRPPPTPPHGSTKLLWRPSLFRPGAACAAHLPPVAAVTSTSVAQLSASLSNGLNGKIDWPRILTPPQNPLRLHRPSPWTETASASPVCRSTRP